MIVYRQILESRKLKFRGLILFDSQGELERRKLKFTKSNIQKIANEYDANIEEINTDSKTAKLRDSRARLIFIEER